MIFLGKNHPNLKAPVVRPNPDLCGIYRVFVPPCTFDRVEARQDARSERGLGIYIDIGHYIGIMEIEWKLL